MSEVVYCGQCGQANSASNKFCNKCGTPIPTLDAASTASISSPSQPIEYEYTSITVRAGFLFTDREVNKKANEMASQGWELVSNTEATYNLFTGPGRVLQFKRAKKKAR